MLRPVGGCFALVPLVCPLFRLSPTCLSYIQAADQGLAAASLRQTAASLDDLLSPEQVEEGHGRPCTSLAESEVVWWPELF